MWFMSGNNSMIFVYSPMIHKPVTVCQFDDLETAAIFANEFPDSIYFVAEVLPV